MSNTETDPEILAKSDQEDGKAAEEEQTSSNNLQQEDAEGSGVMEKETQARMMSVFEQVRNQIRSQGGLKTPKSSMLELVSKIKDIDTGTELTNSQADENNVAAEGEKEAEASNVGCKEGIDSRLEMLSKIFEEKLEASRKVVRDELESQISAVRKEMQAYTDQTLKELESKMTSSRTGSLHSKPQQEGAGAEAKRKASAATTLASRRGKVLTRTLTTTIIPRTSAPIISVSHAKEKSSSKGQSLPVRDHVLSLSGNRPYQGRAPLPPAQPPLLQRRKSFQAKGKTGK